MFTTSAGGQFTIAAGPLPMRQIRRQIVILAMVSKHICTSLDMQGAPANAGSNFPVKTMNRTKETSEYISGNV